MLQFLFVITHSQQIINPIGRELMTASRFWSFDLIFANVGLVPVAVDWLPTARVTSRATLLSFGLNRVSLRKHRRSLVHNRKLNSIPIEGGVAALSGALSMETQTREQTDEGI